VSLHSPGIPSGELKHGLLALIDERHAHDHHDAPLTLPPPKVPVAFAQIMARKAQLIVVCNEDDDTIPLGMKTQDRADCLSAAAAELSSGE
jgi:glucosamine--fructose-6-phosphate aminotransferase (isomerizing)